jgi:hypothetical protein
MDHTARVRRAQAWGTARRAAPPRAVGGLTEWQGEGGAGALDMLPLLLKLGALAVVGILVAWSQTRGRRSVNAIAPGMSPDPLRP